MSGEPELLDAFRAAALSVTKLYKISASSQAKSRTDGYHDCLEDILAFLDREGLGVSDGEASRVRKWVVERIDGREAISQALESEDEAEKPDVTSPQTQRSNSAPQPSVARNEIQMKDPAPPNIPPVQSVSPLAEETEIVVPSLETFSFQSPMPYPPDYMSLANLDLSDTHAQAPTRGPTASSTTPRITRTRTGRAGPRISVSRGAGQKRKVNLAEIFDIGNGKDIFGGGGKRTRLN